MSDPVDIGELVKTLAGLGPLAISFIKSLKRWGKKKEVENYVKEINQRIAMGKTLVRSLIAYRLLNLYTTQVSDDCKDISEKYYFLKEQDLSTKEIASVLKKDCDGTIIYFKQNLNNFRTDSLDQSQALHVSTMLKRIGDLLTAARTNLDNCNIDHFLEDNTNLEKDCGSLRGETYFGIDKLGEEFSEIGGE